MTSVGSAEITIDLLDALYQQKKQQLIQDIAQFQQPVQLNVEIDISKNLQKLNDVRRGILDIQQLNQQASLTSGLADRTLTKTDFDTQIYATAQARSRERIDLAKQEADAIQTQLDRIRLKREQGPAGFNSLIDELKFNKSLLEAQANQERSKLTGITVERDVQFQNLSQGKPAGSKVLASEDFAKKREDSKAEIARFSDAASDLNAQIKQLESAREQTNKPNKQDEKLEADLMKRLVAVRQSAAQESLQIEQRRLKQHEQLEREFAANITVAIAVAADGRRRELNLAIADQQRLQSAYGLTLSQINRQKEALNQTSSILQTQIGLLQQFSQASLGQTQELENLAKLSRDPASNKLTRQEAQRQVKELTGKDSLNELRFPGLNIDQSLTVRRQQQQDAIAQQEARALDSQLQQKQLGLELDTRSEAIARQRLVQEQALAVLKAQQNVVTAKQQVLQAEYTLENLPANATPRERSLARNNLDNARSQLNQANEGEALANRGLGDAKSAAAEFQLLALEARKALILQTEASKQLFNLSDAARERQQSLELSSEGIDPTKFNRRITPFKLSDRTEPIPNKLNQSVDQRSEQLSQFQSRVLSVPLERLVVLNENMLVQNRQMLTELQTIASRNPPPVKTESVRLPSVLNGRGI